MTELIVPQKRGKDTIVTITEEGQVLIFDTDQVLTSNSDRAWVVKKTIEDYAKERGYVVNVFEKNRCIACYSSMAHSSYLAHNVLRPAIKNDPVYIKAEQRAKERRAILNREYGTPINQLKKLVYQLEQKLRSELDEVKEELKSVQYIVADGLDIPAEVLEHDREMLKVGVLTTDLSADHYYQKYSNDLPSEDDILKALELLDK